MAKFQIVVGTSPAGPVQARDDAEHRIAAHFHDWEWISVAADVCCGSTGTDPAVFDLLKNIADNIYNCDCPHQEVIGQTIKTLTPGIAPPLVQPAPLSSGALWAVYVLLKHP